MDEVVELPGPDPEWGHAGTVTGHRNPVLQSSLWESSGYVTVAYLRVRFADVVRRLVLDVEESSVDGLGPVELAALSIDRVFCAVWHFTYEPDWTALSLARIPEDEETIHRGVALLLRALGTDWRAVASLSAPGDRHGPTVEYTGGPEGP